jgi:hypothetical protein
VGGVYVADVVFRVWRFVAVYGLDWFDYKKSRDIHCLFVLFPFVLYLILLNDCDAVSNDIRRCEFLVFSLNKEEWKVESE